MQALRNASFLARLVLAWFALSLGAAIAAPVLHPQGVQLVCSAGGALQLVLPADDGQAPQVQAGMDCPLCATVGAPPAAQWAAGLPLLPAAEPVVPRILPLWVAAPAVPPPARGPPAVLPA